MTEGEELNHEFFFGPLELEEEADDPIWSNPEWSSEEETSDGVSYTSSEKEEKEDELEEAPADSNELSSIKSSGPSSANDADEPSDSDA